MHNDINEKSLFDVKCAMSYEHARALFQAQYLVNLWNNTQRNTLNPTKL